MNADRRRIEQILAQHLPSPSEQETASAGDRAWQGVQLRSRQAMQERFVDVDEAPSYSWRRIVVAAASAAAIAAVVLWTSGAWRQARPLVVAEIVDGSLERIIEGKAVAIHVGETIHQGEMARSNRGAVVLALADGSSVEMRSGSELAAEAADDGVRIRLNNGSVIVTAAKQRTGRLYVSTREVTVSVTGTVFLVSAEDAGSRVAVIEGKVQLQQGTLSQELLPGEQVSTNSAMSVVPIQQEISWSRGFQTHLALLEQAATPARTLQPATQRPAQNPTDARTVFEVASIRPGDPNRGGGRGAGPQGCGGDFQVEPRRFVATNVTLYRLIAIAYGKDCIFLEQSGDLLLGGAEWTRSAPFVIQALMPEGSATYTESEVDTGHAPQLQGMIQSLLADRFKLVLRSEMKEMPVYLLVPGRTPKLTPSKEGDPVRRFVGMAGRGEQRSFRIIGGKRSMADLAIHIQDAVRRTVLDRTGIAGEFNYDIEYAPSGSQIGAETAGLSGPSLFTAIEEQLGLKLEAAKAPVQVLVIDRAEKPSDN